VTNSEFIEESERGTLCGFSGYFEVSALRPEARAIEFAKPAQSACLHMLLVRFLAVWPLIVNEGRAGIKLCVMNVNLIRFWVPPQAPMKKGVP